MECLECKSEIKDTYIRVSDFSYVEKKSPFMDQVRMNSFLDAILEFKDSLNEKTEKINSLNDHIDKLTWYNDLDDECVKLINDLISAIKDLSSSLARQYAFMSFLRQKGIAKEEIRAFKCSVDELKEVYQDLESVFFFLPKMPEFEETTKLLSLIQMVIYCLEDFKVEFEKLHSKKHYRTLQQERIDYFFNKSIKDLNAGTRLNHSDETPYIKKRLRGSGGYRFYFLLLIKEENVYLMFFHPKTGPDGAENITDESKSHLYKKVLSCIQTNDLYKVRLNETQDSIVFEKLCLVQAS